MNKFHDNILNNLKLHFPDNISSDPWGNSQLVFSNYDNEIIYEIPNLDKLLKYNQSFKLNVTVPKPLPARAMGAMGRDGLAGVF